jgi:hypothetical protein
MMFNKALYTFPYTAGFKRIIINPRQADIANTSAVQLKPLAPAKTKPMHGIT